MRKSIIFIFALTLSESFAQAATFEISVTNTSRRNGFGGQNISGPALLVHDSRFSLFTPGQASSKVLWEIAEDGDTSAALALSTTNGVISTHKLTRIPRNQTNPSVNRFTINDSRELRFSLAGMLTTTNDGFAGLNSQKLPSRIGEKVRYALSAWDAGSEENNEMCPFVPCDDHYIRKIDGSEGAVLPHSGIRGIGDIDRIDRGWPADNVVGFVEVVKIN